jgi:ABC-type multidrug transport system fused ATPase/permease subunit
MASIRGNWPSIAAGLIALAAVVAVFRYLLRMLTGRIAAGITYRMSQDLFQRLLLFDEKTRQDYGTGDLLSRGTSDFIYIWRFYSAGYQMSIHALLSIADWLRADGDVEPLVGRRCHVDPGRRSSRFS